MARKKRFERYTDAEKHKMLTRYRQPLAAGKSPTAAARMVGTQVKCLEKWEEEAAAPVAIVKERKCLGGCDRFFRSSGPGERICSSCKRRFAALPAVWSA